MGFCLCLLAVFVHPRAQDLHGAVYPAAVGCDESPVRDVRYRQDEGSDFIVPGHDRAVLVQDEDA
jgi:hypothetical protein